MAAPNIVNVTTITGKTVTLALTTTAQAIVSNPAGSGKVFKINSLYVANVDGVSSEDLTVNLYSEDDIGGTATAFVSTVNVPQDATILVIDKNTAVYLEEDQSIGALAAADGNLVAICSYEEIS